MRTGQASNLPAPMERVRQRFERWRRTRKPRYANPRFVVGRGSGDGRHVRTSSHGPSTCRSSITRSRNGWSRNLLPRGEDTTRSWDHLRGIATRADRRM